MQFCSILSNYFRVEVIKTAKYFELKPGNHRQPFSPPPWKLSKVLKKKNCFPSWFLFEDAAMLQHPGQTVKSPRNSEPHRSPVETGLWGLDLSAPLEF